MMQLQQWILEDIDAVRAATKALSASSGAPRSVATGGLALNVASGGAAPAALDPFSAGAAAVADAQAWSAIELDARRDELGDLNARIVRITSRQSRQRAAA
jgi:hypothetical protein